MLNFIRRTFLGESSSKSRAKSRLSFVLVQDRAGLSSDEMAKFREELVDVIGRYFVIDKAGFDVAYKRETDSTTLQINSPVVVRRQDAEDGEVGVRHKRKKGGKANRAAAM